MKTMKITEKDGSVIVTELEYFDAAQTFDCGQCFRFQVEDNKASGYAFGKAVTFEQTDETTLKITPCTEGEYRSYFEKYISLDADYEKIRDEMKALRPDDKSLLSAMETGKGIRIMRQEPWETLCSFIISQNNNIPRIKKIIDALCKAGAELSGGSEKDFPSPEILVKMGTEGLFAIKTGFRAAYLYDAAVKVSAGEIDLEKIYDMDTEKAAEELCKIKGVGPKVAACTLLFGFGKLDAFPIDVWVKRVISEYYGGNIDPKDFGKYAGLAQQYLFYHKRWLDGKNEA